MLLLLVKAHKLSLKSFYILNFACNLTCVGLSGLPDCESAYEYLDKQSDSSTTQWESGQSVGNHWLHAETINHVPLSCRGLLRSTIDAINLRLLAINLATHNVLYRSLGLSLIHIKITRLIGLKKFVRKLVNHFFFCFLYSGFIINVFSCQRFTRRTGFLFLTIQVKNHGTINPINVI